MRTLTLYLASASPRRRELLAAIGLDPVLVEHDCREEVLAGEQPADLVHRLATAKGHSALRRLDPRKPGVLVAADTVVAIDGQVLGKPGDAADALDMLRRLEGREHRVWTGLFVVRTDVPHVTASAVETTRVRLRSLSDAAREAYVASGEPLDKAGAYAIQGRGALFVEAIDGSWSNVVGLPLDRFASCLDQLGFASDQLLAGRLVCIGQEPISSS